MAFCFVHGDLQVCLLLGGSWFFSLNLRYSISPSNCIEALDVTPRSIVLSFCVVFHGSYRCVAWWSLRMTWS